MPRWRTGNLVTPRILRIVRIVRDAGRTPTETVREAFANTKPRREAIVKAKGRDLHMD